MTLWERRLARVAALEPLWPQAAGILRFHRDVLLFQRELAPRLQDVDAPASLAAFLPELRDLLRRAAPAPLAEAVDSLREVWEGRAGERPEDVGSRILLEAWAAGRRQAGCPHRWAAALLREDVEAGALRRSLVCGLCAAERPQPRVACPGCGEEDPAKLPRYVAAEIPWIRIEACDACKGYLKAVDLSKEPAAEPLVDDLASAALDVVARERGGRKLFPNLAGL